VCIGAAEAAHGCTVARTRAGSEGEGRPASPASSNHSAELTRPAHVLTRHAAAWPARQDLGRSSRTRTARASPFMRMHPPCPQACSPAAHTHRHTAYACVPACCVQTGSRMRCEHTLVRMVSYVGSDCDVRAIITLPDKSSDLLKRLRADTHSTLKRFLRVDQLGTQLALCFSVQPSCLL
jgi:hypothetical protein